MGWARWTGSWTERRQTHLGQEEGLAAGLHLSAGGSVAGEGKGLGEREGREKSSGGEDELELAPIDKGAHLHGRFVEVACLLLRGFESVGWRSKKRGSEAAYISFRSTTQATWGRDKVETKGRKAEGAFVEASMTSQGCARPPRSAPSPRTVRETSPRRSAIRKTVLMASLTSRPRACHRLSLFASPLAMGLVSRAPSARACTMYCRTKVSGAPASHCSPSKQTER